VIFSHDLLIGRFESCLVPLQPIDEMVDEIDVMKEGIEEEVRQSIIIFMMIFMMMCDIGSGSESWSIFFPFLPSSCSII